MINPKLNPDREPGLKRLLYRSLFCFPWLSAKSAACSKINDCPKGSFAGSAIPGKLILITGLLLFTFACSGPDDQKRPTSDWPAYGGNKAGNRYSTLTQINTENVKNLQVAWTYDSADSSANPELERPREIQCQPIVIDGVLYGTSAKLKLFALDAATGKQLWRFEPESQKLNVSRGLVYWESGDDKRILYTVGSGLYAVNAKTGELVKSFGKDGVVSLHEGLVDGLDRDVSTLSVTATSPGVVYKDILIIGSSVAEGGNAAPGSIRGFNIVTGKLAWVFHTIPHPGEVGYDTWPRDAYKRIGGVNSWSGIVLDEKRGQVYFGTGSPSSDFYGGDRPGKNLFANSIVALNAETGKLSWYYQTIAHDLWDRDHPCPPNLTTVRHNGRMVDVVVQATKDGLVYVLDRDKGTSLFPVTERAVPTNGLPGEQPWPVQKYPELPLPFSRQVFTENDISDISPKSAAFTREQYLQFGADHKFAPPSTKGTLLFGYSGGAEWGGNSIDENGILYQNSNDNPWVLQMIDTVSRQQELASVSKGNALYLTNCAACHGADRKGTGSEFPSLTNIGRKRGPDEIRSILRSGSGRMPSFQHLSEQERAAITAYLLNPGSPVRPQLVNERTELKPPEPVTGRKFGFKPAYLIKVWRKVMDQDGYPGVKPPWGTLNAIDLNTGKYLWRVPLGEFPELTKKGIPITGTESYGGPIATAGGLVFIAGTKDERIRAFDRRTGKELWSYQLPAGGFATPATYEVDGTQYVVIAAGGARGQKPGGKYIAFALKP